MPKCADVRRAQYFKFKRKHVHDYLAKRVRFLSFEGGSAQFTPEKVLKSFYDARAVFAKSSPHGAKTSFVLVSVLNWASPCLASSHLQKVQMGLLPFLLEGSEDSWCNSALVVMPRFTHQKTSYGGKKSVY